MATAKNTHKCAAKTCPAQVSAGKLMCAPCWKLVPGDIGREVYAAWDARQRAAKGDDIDAAVTARKAHQTACLKAVASVARARAAKAGV